MRRALLLFLAACPFAFPDAGVLIPSDKQQPDAAILSLDEMTIDVLIDAGNARVRVQQFFGNHTNEVLEGSYLFSLPGRAMISDFAVWDGVTRIPGVILERKEADEIYQTLRAQAIDPGLLQLGERGLDEARRNAIFSVRIVPIPRYGTKRLETEYQERLPVEQYASYFAIPLKPDAYRAQVAGRLRIQFELRSPHALKDFEALSKSYPLTMQEQTPNRVRASFSGTNVTLNDDFTIRYSLDPARADTLAVITHKDAANEPGYFQAATLVAMRPTAPPTDPPRTVVILFDNSLSMQWEKLERSYRAMEAVLRGLRPVDRFNLLLFNTETSAATPAPVEASLPNIEKALAFVKESRLRGGTNMEAALSAALAQAGPNRYLVLLTDGGATRGTIQNTRLANSYVQQWRKLGASDRPRTFVFGVGDDANLPLLRLLARQDGVLETVRSTEPIEFKLNAFLAKIGRQPLENLQLQADPAAGMDMVYPLEEGVFPGSVASWVGQYRQAVPQVRFTASAQRDGAPMRLQATAALPAQAADHPDLPRTWAKARVDALLEKIDRDGEDRATIDEIIRLSRKYKFVTPYTSFLAAPRALLRPRLIRPGDPVLRVKTDPAIRSVVALFPFGLVKPLRYLESEGTWQTRFLAPVEMRDGTYNVRLLLRDREGRTYREQKSFVIASQPPVVSVKLDRLQYRRGDTVRLRVSASATTRTVTARMFGVAPLYLRWSPQDASNTGEFIVPAQLPAGRYTLTVTAEDMAHNTSSQEVPVAVLP